MGIEDISLESRNTLRREKKQDELQFLKYKSNIFAFVLDLRLHPFLISSISLRKCNDCKLGINPISLGMDNIKFMPVTNILEGS
jgi:hypothetical protein